MEIIIKVFGLETKKKVKVFSKCKQVISTMDNGGMGKNMGLEGILLLTTIFMRVSL